jgi:glycosidase
MMNFKFTAGYFRHLIEEMEKQYPQPFMPVYVFSNHDKHRSIKRLNNDLRKAKLLHMLQLTVRGVPCMYYGEEIGMTDAKFPFATALDPIPHKFKFVPRFIFDALGILINRDEVRTPMQWNTTKNAGFSSADKTWLPVHENYCRRNVASQDAHKTSLLNTIRGLMEVRNQERIFQEGTLELIENIPEPILGYRRVLGKDRLLIVLNFDEKEKEFSTEATQVMFHLGDGSTLKDNQVQLKPYSGLILK